MDADPKKKKAIPRKAPSPAIDPDKIEALKTAGKIAFYNLPSFLSEHRSELADQETDRLLDEYARSGGDPAKHATLFGLAASGGTALGGGAAAAVPMGAVGKLGRLAGVTKYNAAPFAGAVAGGIQGVLGQDDPMKMVTHGTTGAMVGGLVGSLPEAAAGLSQRLRGALSREAPRMPTDYRGTSGELTDHMSDWSRRYDDYFTESAKNLADWKQKTANWKFKPIDELKQAPEDWTKYQPDEFEPIDLPPVPKAQHPTQWDWREPNSPEDIFGGRQLRDDPMNWENIQYGGRLDNLFNERNDAPDIQRHLDLYRKDGTIPPPEVLRKMNMDTPPPSDTPLTDAFENKLYRDPENIFGGKGVTDRPDFNNLIPPSWTDAVNESISQGPMFDDPIVPKASSRFRDANYEHLDKLMRDLDNGNYMHKPPETDAGLRAQAYFNEAHNRISSRGDSKFVDPNELSGRDVTDWLGRVPNAPTPQAPRGHNLNALLAALGIGAASSTQHR